MIRDFLVATLSAFILIALLWYFDIIQVCWTCWW